MLPRRLTPDQPETERARWRIVRLDTHETLAGLILSADVDAGVARMKAASSGETVDYSLGPGGIAIIGR